jgi:hypothetical protein
MNSPALHFLADESCDFAVVHTLRADGYDVLAISEVMQRSDDRKLIELVRHLFRPSGKSYRHKANNLSALLSLYNQATSASTVNNKPRKIPC